VSGTAELGCSVFDVGGSLREGGVIRLRELMPEAQRPGVSPGTGPRPGLRGRGLRGRLGWFVMGRWNLRP
jgi:hypothetical protein